MKIKTSNKILLIAGSIPILFIILMFCSLKFISWGGGSPQASNSSSSDLIKRTLPLEGFSEISLKGVWKVNLFQGDSFIVNISAPESAMNEIKAEKNGNELVLDSGTKPKGSGGNRRITAEITLPAVSRIDMEGVTSINLSDMQIESILIRSEGVANISGDKGMIRDLEFYGNGVTRMDLSAVPVTNASLKCPGVYTIKLLMNGGRLSGSLDGVGTFKYVGIAGVNELRVNGPQNKVVHKTK